MAWEQKMIQLIEEMDRGFEQKINQLIEEMDRGFQGIPAAMKDYIFIEPGKHCECCSQVEEFRNKNGALIDQPCSKE